MRIFTKIKFWFLAALIIVGNVSAWAVQGDLIYTLDLAAQSSAFGASNAYAAKTGTVNGVTWFTNAASCQSVSAVWLGTNSAANRTSLTVLSSGVNNRGGAIATALGITTSTVGYYALVSSNSISNVGSIKIKASTTAGTAPSTLWCLYTTDGGVSYTILGSVSNPGTTEQVFTPSSTIVSAQYAFVFNSSAYGTYKTPYFKFYEGLTCSASTTSFASSSVTKLTTDGLFTNTFTTNNSSTKTWSSTNENVATVNSTTGEVTLVGAGSTDIRVNQVADATYCAVVNASYTLTVNAPPAFSISGSSNNNAFGTVSVLGAEITGSPAAGYTYASPAYTVTSGSATVVQNGNVFTVTPSADCNVQINFEAKPTFQLSLVNAGQAYVAGVFPLTTYQGNTTALPTLSSTNGWTFAGWDTDVNKTTAPTYAGGATYTTTASAVTLYAIYSKTTSAIVESLIKTVGFESAEGFTASTTYNNTSPNVQGTSGEQWDFIMGTPSTNNAILNSQSAQMRSYTSNTNKGYVTMKYNLSNVTKITFQTKYSDGVASLNAYYSTDNGVSWSSSTAFTAPDIAQELTYNISATGEYSSVRIKFENASINAAGRLYIDDVKFYGMVNGSTTTYSSSPVNSEPTNHATNFAADTDNSSALLGWADATGAQLPAGYLIKGSIVGFNDIIAPADGATEADGGLVINVSQGVQDHTFSGLTAGNVYYFKIFPYTNSGSNINYKTDGSVPQLSMAVDYPYFRSKATGNWSVASTWERSLNNTDWVDAVIAPTNAATSINILAGHHITVTANATSPGLTLAPTAQLTLNNGFTLGVTGNIILQSQEDTGTATFVDANAAGGLTVSGTTTVQQYVTAGRNWYLSSPVSAATRAVLNNKITGANGGVFSFAEATGLWSALAETDALTVGTGYAVGVTVTGAANFTGGSLNTGSRVLSGLTSTGGNFRGFHLLGNPYPSYLNFGSVTKANLGTGMWVRTKASDGSGNHVFDGYNVPSNVGTNNSGRGAITEQIAPMQAFWVRVDADQTGSITVNNSMRSHQDQSTTGGRLRTRAQEEQKVLRLRVSNGTNADEAILVFNTDASNGLDAYDLQKKSNQIKAIPEIYTQVGDENLTINGMNSVFNGLELPLGFKTDAVNNFSIRASEIRNFGSDMEIVLKDNSNNTERILTPTSEYTFSSDSINTATRFSIKFRSTSAVTDVDQVNEKMNLVVYDHTNGQIAIQRTLTDQALVTVNSALGQQLLQTAITGTSVVLNKTFGSGVYFVSITLEGKTATKKVIIK